MKAKKKDDIFAKKLCVAPCAFNPLPITTSTTSGSLSLEKSQQRTECEAATSYFRKMSRLVGPSLPPHLQKHDSGSEDDDDGEMEGPRLPAMPCRGPAPMGGQPHTDVKADDGESSSDDDYMPALPPGFKARVEARQEEESSEEEMSDSETAGPRIQEQSIGPQMGSSAAREIEERAKRMKDKLEGKEDIEVKRETWMLELPDEKASSFGLLPTARQFSRKGHLGPEKSKKSRSAWTDTPEEKARKAALGIVPGQEEEEEEELDSNQLAAIKRDQAMETVAEELKKKRGTDSLMNLHDKKLKKKKKEDVDDGVKQERRPFDRDVDLQANQFDKAAKKAMLKKAAQINDRFSSGTQKFL